MNGNLKIGLKLFRKIQEGGDPLHRRIAIGMEILVLTGLRKMEIFGLTWNLVDLNNKIIIFPDKSVKNKNEHILPMTNRVFELFLTTE